MVMDFVVGQNSIQKRLTNFGKKVEKDYKNGEKKIQNNIMKNALNLSQKVVKNGEKIILLKWQK